MTTPPLVRARRAWQRRRGVSSPRIAILGAGAGGLAMGVALKKAGIESFTIFEKTDGVGGTWRDNTYPGAQCDIMSHLYSFSFELKKDWSRTYGNQPEILGYFEHVADKYGLRPHLRANTPVAEARWDDDELVWRLRTESGEQVEADVLVSGLGMLNVPALPDVAGLDRFAGPCFHSSRWRHDVDLRGKRVGVVGTGASAIQFVPHVAEQAAQLVLFQRTPQWIMPKVDRDYTAEELLRFRRIPGAARLHRTRIFLRYEKLTSFRLADETFDQRTTVAREHLERAVPDPALRAKLTPDYPIGCKRLLLSNRWYPALCRDNVEVVTDKISEVTPTGVVTADGTSREVDVLILGTGFQATNYLGAVDIVGRGGRRLRDDWRDGAQAYLGTTVSGYPNLFTLYGPNTNQGGNSIIFVIEAQVHYVLRALGLLRRSRARALDVRREVQDRFNDELQAAMKGTIWDGGCSTYYKDPSGRITTQWPYRASRLWARTRVVHRRDYDLLGARS